MTLSKSALSVSLHKGVFLSLCVVAQSQKLYSPGYLAFLFHIFSLLILEWREKRISLHALNKQTNWTGIYNCFYIYYTSEFNFYLFSSCTAFFITLWHFCNHNHNHSWTRNPTHFATEKETWLVGFYFSTHMLLNKGNVTCPEACTLMSTFRLFPYKYNTI